MDASIAQRNWEAANSIESVDPDSVYGGNVETHEALIRAKPWTKDPNYFKKVQISALALLKMVMHARSGGTIEVMGIMQGRIQEETMIVTDAFALPVEGTETRVNAAVEGYEYMINYLELIKMVGRVEHAVGWYHSHPGYGCWLSGIDVETQKLNQQHQEPWLAVVVDPTRTISTGKVEIGAFRTYPEDYRPPDAGVSEYQTIPSDKIEDFGVHSKKYYSLDISYYKSSLDNHLLGTLWSKYWVNTLASSPLLTNRNHYAGQLADLALKVEQAEAQFAQTMRIAGYSLPDKKKDSPLSRITKDSSKVALEQLQSLLASMSKDSVFKGCCSHGSHE
eukprot:TRINITY_DN1598_c0_g1_i1.p1 TRINITY_DN1598_c0_g1~~TRINITY_DN1598_c0_g1_i1.p1  ORF type:complete len:335 (+),score=74.55 TRINITY_DN1598_c0_g1_i1:74-1078(+)